MSDEAFGLRACWPHFVWPGALAAFLSETGFRRLGDGTVDLTNPNSIPLGSLLNPKQFFVFIITIIAEIFCLGFFIVKTNVKEVIEFIEIIYRLSITLL